MKNDHVYYLAMSHDGIVSRKLKVKEGHIYNIYNIYNIISFIDTSIKAIIS